MKQYIKEYYSEAVNNILNGSNDEDHVSLYISLEHLHKTRPELFLETVQDIWKSKNKWSSCLLSTQKELIEGNIFLEPGYQIKENCHVRFVNLPQNVFGLRTCFPNNDDIGQIVQIKGNVVRMTQIKLLELKREYICKRCKEIFTIEAKYEKMYTFDIPRNCPNVKVQCKGTLSQRNSNPKSEFCMDYQEIRVQESFSDKHVPASIVVTLENDLVDYCQPGESITICGTVERRWQPIYLSRKSEVILCIRAFSITKEEAKFNFGKDLSEQLFCVRAQWQETVENLGELKARDLIIQSICPEVHGLYIVKLAIALSLCSGFKNIYQKGTTRSNSHLLLVGDPGLAKSRLLKNAARIVPRSIHTTGLGCSTAGLTVAVSKEDGEWQLEAGALVLADGGVCCIDEFNLMRENDKASIHEAMEQQTISMAKAGLVCNLSTRCVVLAATNPKNLYRMSECEGTSSVNIGLGSPLISRFDIVLILRDERDPKWDINVANHILYNFNKTDDSSTLWSLKKLQSHFLAVNEIIPKISHEAHEILACYYKYCRSDEMRDPSRTSVRLIDSLNRLAQSHARLLLREEVNAIDAITVILLMECSFGFGKLLNSNDRLMKSLSIGPSSNEISTILKILKYPHASKVLEDYKKYVKIFQKNESNLEDIKNEKNSVNFESETDFSKFSEENEVTDESKVLKICDLERKFGKKPTKSIKFLRPSNEKNGNLNGSYGKTSQKQLTAPNNEISTEISSSLFSNLPNGIKDFDETDLDFNELSVNKLNSKVEVCNKGFNDKYNNNKFLINDFNLNSISQCEEIEGKTCSNINNLLGKSVKRKKNYKNKNGDIQNEFNNLNKVIKTEMKQDISKNPENFNISNELKLKTDIKKSILESQWLVRERFGNVENHGIASGSYITKSSAEILAERNEDLTCLDFDL